MSDTVKVADLEVEVTTSSGKSAEALKSLASSLEKTKQAVAGLNLYGTASQVKALAKALAGLPQNSEKLRAVAADLKSLAVAGSPDPASTNSLSQLQRTLAVLSRTDTAGLARLSEALARMRGVGNLNLTATLAELERLPAVAAAISNIDTNTLGTKLTGLRTALSSLSALGTTNLNVFTDSLRRLPELTTALNAVDLDRLQIQVRQLTSALQPLSRELATVSTGLGALDQASNRAEASVTRMGAASATSASRVWGFIGKLTISKQVLTMLTRTLSGVIASSNEYVEDMNLFTAAMGKYANEAAEYAEKVSAVMGIDPADWMRNQGTFQTITTGFGVAADRAALMSKNLTQLGYDISSFFNLPVEQSMQKLQSGIAGELEPLRRIGYDLSIATMQEYANALGIEKKVSAMTQAEKAELRYYMILKQVTVAQGDMARTLNAPANQLRVLKAQLDLAARSIGNIFIPMLNALLPYLIVAAKLIRKLADAVAKFFGYEFPEVDYSGLSTPSIDTSGMDGLADATDKAGKKAGKTAKKIKEIKNNLLGIDELNILQQPDTLADALDTATDAGTGLDGKGLGIELPEYDFLSGLNKAVQTRVNEIMKVLEDALKKFDFWLGAAEFLIGAILVFTGVNIPVGLVMMSAGAARMYNAFAQNSNMAQELKDELTRLKIFIEGMLIVIGAVLIFTKVNIPLGLALFAMGAAGLAGEVACNWSALSDELKKTLADILLFVGGALLAIGVTLAFTGVNLQLGLALMAAGAVSLMTGAVASDNIADTLQEKLDSIMALGAGLMLGVGLILVFCGKSFPIGLGLIAAGAFLFGTSEAVQSSGFVKDLLTGEFSDLISLGAVLMLAVGLLLTFSGGNVFLGVGLLAEGATILGASLAANWNTVQEMLQGPLGWAAGLTGAALVTIGLLMVCSGVAVPIGLGLIAAGAIALVSAATANWDSIKELLQGPLGMAAWLTGVALLSIGLLMVCSGVGIGFGLALMVAGVGAIAASMAANWDSIKEPILGALNGIWNGLQAIGMVALGILLLGCPTSWGYAFALINEGISSLVTGRAPDWSAPAKQAESILNEVSKKVEEFWTGICNWFGQAGKDISDFSANVLEWFVKGKDGKNIWDHFAEYGGHIVQGLIDGVTGWFGKAKNTVCGWAGGIADWFSEKLGIQSPSRVMLEKGQFLVEGLNKGIDTYTKYKSKVTGWGRNIGEWFESAGATGKKFLDKGVSIVSGLIDGVAQKKSAAETSLKNLGSSALESFKSRVDGKFRTVAEAMTGEVSGGIDRGSSNAQNSMHRFGSAMPTSFNNGVGTYSFYNAAINMANGLIDGINSAWDNSMQAMKDWAKGLTNTFKNFLDIHSPSGVFRGYGEYTVLGFNAGITDNMKSTQMAMDDWSERYMNLAPKVALQVDTSQAATFDPRINPEVVTAGVHGQFDLSGDSFVEGFAKVVAQELVPYMKKLADNSDKQLDRDQDVNVYFSDDAIYQANKRASRRQGFDYNQ